MAEQLKIVPDGTGNFSMKAAAKEGKEAVIKVAKNFNWDRLVENCWVRESWSTEVTKKLEEL